MTIYTVEHFQHGKLSKSEGSDFDVTACSSGLLRDFDVLRKIAQRFRLYLSRPNLVDEFSDAYAFRTLNDRRIIAHFQRSPSKESAKRPYYFVQAHYAIIDSELYVRLRGNLRPLFRIFDASIPRYEQTTELEPIIIDDSELPDGKEFQVDARVIPFLSRVFDEQLVLFSHPGSSPCERLNFLTELVGCFPTTLRSEISFVTSFDETILPNTEGYRIAFEASMSASVIAKGTERASLNSDFLNKAPTITTGDKGFHYVRLLSEWLQADHGRSTIVDQLGGLRFPSGISLTTLQESALFERLFIWIMKVLDDPDSIRENMADDSISSFVREYGQFLESSEAETILARVQMVVDSSHTKSLAGLIVNLYQINRSLAFKNQVFQWFRQTLASPEAYIVREVYEHLLRIDQSFSEELLRTFAESFGSDITLLPVGRALYQWHIDNRASETSLVILLNMLIEYDSVSQVFQEKWWDLLQSQVFAQQITQNARNALGVKAPKTLILLTDLMHSPRDLPDDTLIGTYMETNSISWLTYVVDEAVRRNAIHLFNVHFFTELAKIIRDHGEADRGLSILRKIGVSTIERLARNLRKHGTQEELLIAARDCTIEIMHQLSLRQEQERHRQTFIYYYKLFGIYCHHLHQSSVSLRERDDKLDSWAAAYVKRVSVPVSVQISEARLSSYLALSALARSFGYPAIYASEFGKTSDVNIGTSNQSLYVWSSIIAYKAQQSRWQSFLKFDVSRVFDKLLLSILQSDVQVMLYYLVQFSKQVDTSDHLKRAWLRQLVEVPYLMPSCAEQNGNEMLEELNRAKLYGAAEALKLGLDKMDVALKNAKEFIYRLNSAERSITSLVDYANREMAHPQCQQRIDDLQHFLRYLNLDTEVQRTRSRLYSFLEDRHLKQSLLDLLSKL